MTPGKEIFGQQGLQIPVDDPEAALRFCRSLAQVLEGQETAESSVALPSLARVAPRTVRPDVSVKALP